MTGSEWNNTQENRILWLLSAAWPNWTPAPELAKISLQYNSRIFSLRRQKGWLIENRVRVDGRTRHGEFRLGSSSVPSSRELRQPKVTPTPNGSRVLKVEAGSGSLFGDLAADRTYLG
jgi:hypothetical protein